MKEAVNIIKKYHRSSSEVKVQPAPAPEPEAKPAPKSKSRLASRRKARRASKNATEQTNKREEKHVEPDPPVEGTEQLLHSILNQLKSMQRADMFGEFSIIRFVAGVLQIIVPFCLLIAIGLLMRLGRQDSSVFIALGFAMVLQVMSLTLYIMRGRK
jgi:hypothetical protein